MRNSVLESWHPSSICALVLAVLLHAIECAIVIAIISNFIGYKPDPLLADVLFHYRKGFMPERELLIYGLSLIAATGGFGLVVYMLRHQLIDSSFARKIWRYTFFFGVMTLILVAAALWAYLTPAIGLARVMLLGALVVSLLCKIFWMEINALICRR